MEARRRIIYSGTGFSLRGEKGRFVLPPDFRNPVKESSFGDKKLFLMKHDRWNCLVGFGDSRRQDMLEQLERQQQAAWDAGKDFDFDIRASQLFACLSTPFDDSGRFIIPAGLVAPGCIGEEIFFLGGGPFFTLWSEAELDKMGTEHDAAKSMCSHLSREARAKAKGAAA